MKLIKINCGHGEILEVVEDEKIPEGAKVIETFANKEEAWAAAQGMEFVHECGGWATWGISCPHCGM